MAQCTPTDSRNFVHLATDVTPNAVGAGTSQHKSTLKNDTKLPLYRAAVFVDADAQAAACLVLDGTKAGVRKQLGTGDIPAGTTKSAFVAVDRQRPGAGKVKGEISATVSWTDEVIPDDQPPANVRYRRACFVVTIKP